MAYIRTDNLVSPATVFQAVIGLFKRAAAQPEKAAGKSGARLTDARTRKALDRLSDEQLGDIGVYRKIRDIKWDTLARPPHPQKTVIFDYFTRGD